MSDHIDVFISSTSRDLEKYRENVTQAILRMGAYPIVMEAFNPTDRSALQLCYDKVQEADFFVGIYAYRYGHAPAPGVTYKTTSGEIRTGDGITGITDLEYRWAMERGIPALLFVVSDTDATGAPLAWPVVHLEDEPGKSHLQTFKSELMSKHVVGFFHSPDHLAMQVVTALSEMLPRQRGHAAADWGEAPDAETFLGREAELSRLEHWLTQDRTALVAVLGMGGMGKTSLAARLSRRLQPRFTSVIWRSLRNAPPLADILKDLIRFIAADADLILPGDVDASIALLLKYMQEKKCLVVLDNVETILQGGRTGSYLEGYEKYGDLFKRIGEAHHASTLLITSREKPREVAVLESTNPRIHSLQLSGLLDTSGRQLLDLKGLVGSEEAKDRLITRYAGNPLALNLVATAIQELFSGQIQDFFAQGTVIFDDVRDVLDQQINRLSTLEKIIMMWLAINRQPVSMPDLLEDIAPRTSPERVFNALKALKQRSLVETIDSTFTLQNVIMEYMVDLLTAGVSNELLALDVTNFFPRPGSTAADALLPLLNSHALIKATTRDYIRDAQIRLILRPVIDQLLASLGTRAVVERRLKDNLDAIRRKAQETTDSQPRVGYAGGNLINLLTCLEADLTGCDFSGLAVWQAFLRGVKLHNVSFENTDLSRCIFTETLTSVFSLAFSPDGQTFAIGDYASRVHVWEVAHRQKVLTCEGHTGLVWATAYSPDGKFIASGSDDQSIRLWDTQTGQCVHTFTGHTGWVRALAYSPDGNIIASGSYDQTVKLWHVPTGQCLKTLSEHTGWLRAVAFSPDGNTLATGGSDRSIRLWDVAKSRLTGTLDGHENAVYSLAFSPDGKLLASASADQTVKLWDWETRTTCAALTEHTNEVYSVAFSPDGRTLASAGQDLKIKLWDVTTPENVRSLTTLHGHTSWIWALAFNPGGQTLLSGSADQSVKLWDIRDINESRCLVTWEGYSAWMRSIAFSPDGSLLATGSADHNLRFWDAVSDQPRMTVTAHNDQVASVAFGPDGQLAATGGWDGLAKLWDVKSGVCRAVLSEHHSTPWAVAFSPDSKLLATGSNDATARLWDTATGQSLFTLQGHRAPIYAVAFSPDGKLLATGSFDATIRLWDRATGVCTKILTAHAGEMITSVAFSPDGSRLASGSRNSTLRLWDIASAQTVTTLRGHDDKMIAAVAFSPDGSLLASGGGDNQVYLWDAQTYQNTRILSGHTHWVNSLAFHPDGSLLATASSDETARLYDMKTGQCVRVLRARRLYEGLNIKGVTSLHEAQKATLISLGAVR